MTLEEEYTLSYYRQIAVLNEAHGVFLVQHTESGKIYVKKILRVFDAAIFFYLKEHPLPHIPQIYEVVEDDNTLVVIEEYMSGTPLSEIMEKEGKIDQPRALDIVFGVCEALKGLHLANPPIIHRDIKPSNVIVTSAGEVVLLDMNAAKKIHVNATQDTHLIGTHGYAAPEQYGFGTSDERTDIYACGVLLNKLLTGYFPSEQMTTDPMCQVIQKCINIKREDRYHSVADLQNALHSLQQGERIQSGQKEMNRYLPPGFRAKKPAYMVLAAVGYIFFFAIGLTMELKDASIGHVWVNRLSFLMSVGCIILFSGNYLNIWERMQINRLPYRWLRVAVIILVDVVILFFVLLIFGIAEQIIFGTVPVQTGE